MEEIFMEFFQSDITSVAPFGDGHINDTFLVKAGGRDYVCQRVRKAMDLCALENNYLLLSKACREAGWTCPEWMKTRDGSYFCQDPEGEHWRAYPLIQGEILAAPLSREGLWACGQGLAKMHRILQTLPKKLIAVYPMLHDLGHYFQRYEEVLRGDELLGEHRDEKLEEMIEAGRERFLRLEIDRSAIVHGDAKLANVLFREGRVVAWIDLDTVMEGSLLEDVADCMRSACVRDGRLDQEAARALLGGYQSEAPELLGEETGLLPEVIRKLFFELALRYYTDAISKHRLFREKYPGYLLEKARGYFGTIVDVTF